MMTMMQTQQQLSCKHASSSKQPEQQQAGAVKVKVKVNKAAKAGAAHMQAAPMPPASEHSQRYGQHW
jgi:hypothetical protein